MTASEYVMGLNSYNLLVYEMLIVRHLLLFRGDFPFVIPSEKNKGVDVRAGDN